MTAIARRPLLLGTLAGLGLAAIGLLAYETPRIFEPRYPRTPYDDLLGRLPNRDDAVRLGSAVLDAERDFDPQSTARALRARLGSMSLAAAADADVRDARLTEVHGWVLPSVLTALCALAASASQPRNASSRAVPPSPAQTSGI
jgi:hypothetical protein